MATANTDEAPLLEQDASDPNAVLVHARASLTHVPSALIHDASIPLLPPRYFPSFAAHHGMSFGPAALVHPEAWRVVHPPSADARGATYRVSFVGLAFALMFTAYNVAQTFLTTLFPTFGFYSFATIYLFFALGSLVAPNVGSVLGLVPSMVLGGFSYIGLIATFLTHNGMLLLIVSAVNGFGGGLLWIHQGMWITQAAAAGGASGYLTGLFFLIFNINAVLGNAIVIGSAAAGLSTDALLLIMVAIGGAGAFMLLFTPNADGSPRTRRTNKSATVKPQAALPHHHAMAEIDADAVVVHDDSQALHPNPDGAQVQVKEFHIIAPEGQEKRKEENTSETQVGGDTQCKGPVAHPERTGLGAWLRLVWHVWGEPWTKLLAPYMVQQGVGLAFSFTVLPSLTPADIADIGYLFLSYGVTGCLASLLLGRVFDKWGWPYLLAIHLGSTAAAYACALTVYLTGLDYRFQIISAALFGVVDNASNSVVNMTISQMYVHDASPAFSLYRFMFCIGLAGTSIVASDTGPRTVAALACGSCVLAAASYTIMRRWCMPPTQPPCPTCPPVRISSV